MLLKKLIAAFVAVVALNVAVMADSPENPTSWITTLGAGFSDVTYRWDYSGSEPTWDSRLYKTVSLSHPWSSGPDYVVVQSANIWGGDPKCYYKYNGTWTYLSDDHGSGVNFKAVVHFNGAVSSQVELLYNHFSTTDFAYDVRLRPPINGLSLPRSIF